MKKPKLNRLWKAVLWCVVVVVSAFVRKRGIPFYVGGSLTMQINFDGALLAFVSVFGGSLYGALAYMESDVLGYLLRQNGAYMIQFTVVAACKGIAVGVLWRVARSIRAPRVGVACAVGFAVMAAVGSFNAIFPNAFENHAYARWTTALGAEAAYLSTGLVIGGCVGLASCALAYVLYDRARAVAEAYFRALFAIVLPGVAGTMVNTWILSRYYLTAPKTFMAILLPRVGMEALLSSVNAYLLAALVAVFCRVFIVAEDF